MRTVFRFRPLFVLVAFFITAAAAIPVSNALLRSEAGQKREYVCPPCGCSKDQEVFAESGYCPACGMALAAKGSESAAPQTQAPRESRKAVAILIFDGVQIIDYAGPYEVFGQAGFSVYTVARKPDPITTAMGMKVTPSYSFDNSPKPDVVVIPGGGVTNTQNDPATIKWIQDKSKDAEHVLSVCNGAFILAKTGLLDGLSATTFYNLIDGLAALAPKTKVVTNQRYVDNGKIITTAGLSSGIDGSLYVVSKMRGKAAAQMVALNMEYNWQPDSGYARADFADRHLRRIFSSRLLFTVPAGTSLKVISTQGGPDKWEVNWQVVGNASPAEVSKLVGDKLAADGKWIRQDSRKPPDDAMSAWKFTDEKGASWNGIVSVKPVAGERERLAVTIRINREGLSG
jgi:putative intracellular protease/amidase